LLKVRGDFSTQPSNGGASTSEVSYRIGAFEVRNFEVVGEDQLAYTPARVELLVDRLLLTQISSSGDEPMEVSGNFILPDDGMLTLEGSGQVVPMKVELAVKGESVPVSLVEPYLDHFVLIDIEGGKVSMDGKVEVNGENAEISVVVQGDGAIENAESLHEEFPEGRIRLSRLQLDQFEFQSEVPRFYAGKVTLEALEGTYFRKADGTFLSPFREVDVKEEVAIPQAPGTGEAGKGMELQVDRVEFKDGNFTFIDRSVEPAFRATVSGLSGEIENLGNAPDSETRFSARGSLNEMADWDLTGKGNLLAFEEALEFDFELAPFSLTQFNPYSSKYLGRKIDKGKLGLSLDYSVESSLLEGSNQVRVNKMVLGETVPSEDKLVHFPLGLAVAALEDRNGLMDLKVDVSGRLDDPSFSVGGIVMKAILNILSKAATAPFSMLASLVGTEEELSFVSFNPGSTVLDETALKRIEALAMALEKRPGLSLEYSGGVDPLRDRNALKMAELKRLLEQLQRRDPNAPQGDLSQSDLVYRELMVYASQTMGDTVEIFPELKGDAPPLKDRSMEMEEEVPLSDAADPEPEPMVELEVELAQVNRSGAFLPRLFGIGGRGDRSTEQVEPIVVTGRMPSEDSKVEKPPKLDIPVPDTGARAGLSMDFPEELPPAEVLEEQLISRMVMSDLPLNALARKREEAVRKQMVETFGIPAERLFVVEHSPEEEGEALPQVRFSISSR
jgi:hypothetical protein